MKLSNEQLARAVGMLEADVNQAVVVDYKSFAE